MSDMKEIALRRERQKYHDENTADFAGKFFDDEFKAIYNEYRIDGTRNHLIVYPEQRTATVKLLGHQTTITSTVTVATCVNWADACEIMLSCDDSQHKVKHVALDEIFGSANNV